MRRALLPASFRAPLIIAKRLLVDSKDVRDISGLTEDTAPDALADYGLTYDGSALAPKKVLLRNQGVTALTKTGQSLVHDNSVALSTIISFSVPPNSLGIHGAMRFGLRGQYLNNDGAGRTLIISISFGGTVMWSDTSASIVNNALARPFELDIVLFNKGVTNSQGINGSVRIGNVVAATDGLGDLATAGLLTTSFAGTAAVDTTGNRTFSVSMQHSAASANLSFTRDYAYAELI